MSAAAQLDLASAMAPPAAGLFETEPEAANALAAEWGHYLGPCYQPFGMQAWRLDVAGLPVSLGLSASTVSRTVAGYSRGQVVELARLCTPGHQWATRVMLRLWRETGGPAWPYWTPRAAVAYGKGRHSGHICSFDGWRRITRTGPSGPPGTRGRRRERRRREHQVPADTGFHRRDPRRRT